MKTRTIPVVLIVGLLLALGGSSATASNPPTIEVVQGGVCAPVGADGTIYLRVGDDVTPPANLVVTAASLNTWFVPNANITLGFGPVSHHRWMNVVALPNAAGPNATTIRVTVKDGDGNSAYVDVFVHAGDQGVNTVTGSAGPDMLFGLAKWDTLMGGAGNDLLCGGPDADTLMGGPGDDTLFGNAGDDVLNCGPGNNDEGNGGPGSDINAWNSCEYFWP